VRRLERETTSLESISGRTFAHCLLGQQDLPIEQQEQECWGELREIIAVVADQTGRKKFVRQALPVQKSGATLLGKRLLPL
jgi:hypothetical protein